MNTPLVSVIIPIYNVSDYLYACVKSACNQTYTNLEIILVDDGSPDDCPQQCDTWAKKDDRIKVIHKHNGGLSDARNAGLDVATGKYVYFLDGDDTIQPDLIETIVMHMEAGADMVAFRFMQIHPDGSHKPGQAHEINTFVLSDEKSRHDFIIEKLLTEKIGWEAWSRIYRREKIEKYNLRFADNKKIFAEDLYFCLCYCAHAEKIISIPDFLYNYMVRSDSIMNTQKNNLNIGRMNELCKELLVFWTKHDDCRILTSSFPVIHFLVINNVLNCAFKAIGNTSPNITRKEIQNDIQDTGFFKKQVKGYFKNIKQLEKLFPGFFLAERLSFLRFLLNGSRINLSLRNRILYRINVSINYYFGCTKKRANTVRKALKNKNTVVVVGTEDFGNIGDHQIAVSMIEFIKNTLPDHNIIEITASKYQQEKIFLKNLKPHHIIALPGGGNFGNIYPFAQNIREEIATNFPENKKIIFPQTIHFSDNEAGKAAIKKAVSLFTKENNIFLFTRDSVSFDFAKKYFSCSCFFAPDIVLSQENQTCVKQRNNVLLCMRNDTEGCSSYETISYINKILSENNLHSVKFDTQLDYNVDIEKRNKITKDTLELWASSKLIITDRLHGLIFAAVTGTPCIALRNYNHKISGTYEFIKYLPYIKFVQTETEIKAAFEELITMKDCHYDNTPLLPYYEKLAEVLKQN